MLRIPQTDLVAPRYPPISPVCLVVGMEHDTPLSRRIRQAIAASGLTQMEIAVAVGVSRPQVTMWASGSRAPGRENLRALATALSVSPEWLLEGRHIIEVKDDESAAIVQRLLASPESVRQAIKALLPPLPEHV